MLSTYPHQPQGPYYPQKGKGPSPLSTLEGWFPNNNHKRTEKEFRGSPGKGLAPHFSLINGLSFEILFYHLGKEPTSFSPGIQEPSVEPTERHMKMGDPARSIEHTPPQPSFPKEPQMPPQEGELQAPASTSGPPVTAGSLLPHPGIAPNPAQHLHSPLP